MKGSVLVGCCECAQGMKLMFFEETVSSYHYFHLTL
jgi:hypothetical protein